MRSMNFTESFVTSTRTPSMPSFEIDIQIRLSFFMRIVTVKELSELSTLASTDIFALSLSKRNSRAFKLVLSVRAFLKSRIHFPLLSVIGLRLQEEKSRMLQKRKTTDRPK